MERSDATGQILDRLWEAPSHGQGQARGGGMPPTLERRFRGELLVPLDPDRPVVIANFVSTLDGIVALGANEPKGGGPISGYHEPDRFVMALLRAVADVVVIGAGTLRAATRHRWNAAHLQPQLATEFATWRSEMGLAPQPTTVMVTGSGDLPASHPALDDPDVPVVIATTYQGEARLRRAGMAEHVGVESLGDGDHPLTGAQIVEVATRLGAHVALCEGGPHLLAELVASDLVDELFLTLAPQVVGRARDGRIGLVEGLGLPPEDARWQQLVSVRRSGDHLLLRYRRVSRRHHEQERSHA